jgi:hypothetical protein
MPGLFTRKFTADGMFKWFKSLTFELRSKLSKSFNFSSKRFDQIGFYNVEK